MEIYLKIKLKTLAEETRLIRKEEKKIVARNRARIEMQTIGNSVILDNPEMPAADRERIQNKINASKERAAKAARAFEGMNHHRTHLVRKEARASYLAYGFMRGVPYKKIENLSHHKPDWTKVKSIIQRFNEEGSQAWESRFEAWMAE